MNELVLVFLFAAGQVQFTSFGHEVITPQTISDSEEMKPEFIKKLKDLTNKPNVKICAVVPTYEFSSPLHKPLYDLLTEKIETLPGIWEQHEGVRTVLKLNADAPVTIGNSEKYCRLVARVAFK